MTGVQTCALPICLPIVCIPKSRCTFNDNDITVLLPESRCIFNDTHIIVSSLETRCIFNYSDRPVLILSPLSLHVSWSSKYTILMKKRLLAWRRIHTKRREATQQNCSVSSRRRRIHTKQRDASELFRWDASRRSCVHTKRRDSTKRFRCVASFGVNTLTTRDDQFSPVFQILNIFSFWPVELRRIVSTFTPKDATRL